MFLKTFGGSLVVAVVGLVLGYLYGGATGLAVTAILAVLEVSLSFDNAVVNATVLVRMSAFWQKIFLTVGVAIAVFGMRLIFPLLIVGITAKLTPVEAVRLALEKGDPDTKGTYGYLLHQAHPAIAAFGGIFLLLLFLDFVFEEREITWLTPIEKGLPAHRQARPALGRRRADRAGRQRLHARAGQQGVDRACVRACSAWSPTCSSTRSASSSTWETRTTRTTPTRRRRRRRRCREGRREEHAAKAVVGVVGKAAFFLFLYLEVLDASFSFDGVVGAFAITSDPIIIAIGLGVGRDVHPLADGVPRPQGHAE